MNDNLTAIGTLLDAASSMQTSKAVALRQLHEARTLLDEGGFTFSDLLRELQGRPAKDYSAEMDRMVATFESFMSKFGTAAAVERPTDNIRVDPRNRVEKAIASRKAGADRFAQRVRAEIAKLNLGAQTDPKIIAYEFNLIGFKTATGKLWDGQGVRNALRRQV